MTETVARNREAGLRSLARMLAGLAATAFVWSAMMAGVVYAVWLALRAVAR